MKLLSDSQFSYIQLEKKKWFTREEFSRLCALHGHMLYMFKCLCALCAYLLLYITRVHPYVICILRAYVCRLVCIYTLPSWRFLPFARCLRHTSGVRINDVMLSLSFQVLLPNSFIPISKYVIFHLQRQNSSSLTNGEKTIWYMVPRKDDIYWYRM